MLFITVRSTTSKARHERCIAT